MSSMFNVKPEGNKVSVCVDGKDDEEEPENV